ncbi:Ras guanine nucleotide exchange factor bud5, partial [Coemansia furcata]
MTPLYIDPQQPVEGDESVLAKRCEEDEQVHHDETCRNPNDILFNSEGRVSYGTWRGLVMYLTQVSHTAEDFTHAFFLVFRSFATPSDFAEALVARARESPTTKLTPAETKTWNDRVQAPIRHNVFLAIKTWYENYWYSADDGLVLSYLCGFLLN